ncbi:hypothetical protein VNO77_21797 [Canavalia gladiata]|uniref:Uncharacterized protein n=1 Tax=Canavalia gladiata TaxID=3824 RepID=A0AAN9QAG4_CANGL
MWLLARRRLLPTQEKLDLDVHLHSEVASHKIHLHVLNWIKRHQCQSIVWLSWQGIPNEATKMLKGYTNHTQ